MKRVAVWARSAAAQTGTRAELRNDGYRFRTGAAK